MKRRMKADRDIAMREYNDLRKELIGKDFISGSYTKVAFPGCLLFAWVVIFPWAAFDAVGIHGYDMLLITIFNIIIGVLVFNKVTKIMKVYFSLPKEFRRKSLTLKALRSHAVLDTICFFIFILSLTSYCAVGDVMDVKKNGVVTYIVPMIVMLLISHCLDKLTYFRYRLAHFNRIMKEFRNSSGFTS